LKNGQVNGSDALKQVEITFKNAPSQGYTSATEEISPGTELSGLLIQSVSISDTIEMESKDGLVFTSQRKLLRAVDASMTESLVWPFRAEQQPRN
jgi:hypothetical protein